MTLGNTYYRIFRWGIFTEVCSEDLSCCENNQLYRNLFVFYYTHRLFIATGVKFE